MAPARDDLFHIHRPVMVAEVLEHLLAGVAPAAPALFVDGTVGLGGHAAAILEARPEARVLGLDRDPRALELAAERLASHGARVRLEHASYADLGRILVRTGEEAPWGILLDLGASSLQFDDPARGFSFREGMAGADMRFDPTSGDPTALDLVNHLEERELVRILSEYGEEPRSRSVAKRIVAARPFTDGARLAEVVRSAAAYRRGRDAATRTFQALRIAVNDEFTHLDRGLEAAIDCAAPGACVVVISFHSGEDRRVKNAFREAARAGRGHVRTKKPVRPTDAEVKENRRARPARLRAFERIEDAREEATSA
ncbi:MAG: 16S rRNA (cytosine(1402)-N(4))-methyltransferase RsmH [Planctomycetota bacterium]|jgi:16S rRNA (cytosine1402-N4)-methyltransferase